MSCVAIGVDLISVERLKKLSRRALERVFSERELELCQCGSPQRQAERLAGRFAAKEAVLKALGTGLSGGMRWKDVEILQTVGGAPEVALSGGAARRLAELGGAAVRISIAHEGGMAMSAALLIRREDISSGNIGFFAGKC